MYLFHQSDSENEFLDKKDFDPNSTLEKSTQTLADEKQKIVDKLKKKLSATKSAQMRHGNPAVPL